MITHHNIKAFITYLYQKRKGSIPPQNLLDGWQALSDADISKNLSGLFESWGYSELQKRDEIKYFLQSQSSPIGATNPVYKPPVQEQSSYKAAPTQAAPPPKNPKVMMASDVNKPKKKSWMIWVIVLPLLLLGAYAGISYVRYISLGHVYAITNNILVRNDEAAIVARMDINESNSANGSFQKLKAFDNKVYYRTIDSSNKTYPNRKVLLKDNDFLSYLLGTSSDIGYVNTNYVVDNLSEFELYQTVFSDVAKNKSANDDLKAIYRRIIIGSMNENPQLNDRFLVLHDYGLGKEALNKTQAILKEPLEKNISYTICAGLNDNHYYRFEGDIRDNIYKQPALLMLYRDGEAAEPLRGNYRFYNKAGEVYLYDCSEKKFTEHIAERDGSGRIIGFKYVVPPEPTIIDYIDTLKENVRNVLDTIF